jgi:hypothetical protein
LSSALARGAEKAELFIRSVCDLHNFITEENRNGDALLQRTAEAVIEDHNNLTDNVAIRPTTCTLDVRNLQTVLFPLLGHFSGKIITCSRSLPYYH